MDEPSSIRRAYCASGVGKGWFPLVYACEGILDAFSPGWTPAQVKEKFGGLRFYYDATTPSETADDLIRDIEDISYCVCEVTGKPGKLRTEGRSWVQTLSDEVVNAEPGASFDPVAELPEGYQDLYHGSKLWPEWVPLVWACHGVLDQKIGRVNWRAGGVRQETDRLVFEFQTDVDAADPRYLKALELIRAIEIASAFMPGDRP